MKRLYHIYSKRDGSYIGSVMLRHAGWNANLIYIPA